MAMTRFPQKHISTTNVVFLWLVAILGAAFIANLFWASFSSGHLFIASNLVTENSPIEPIPNASSIIRLNKEEASRNVKKRYPARFLTGAYADLPAPDLHWEEMPPAPVPRLDGASIQIKNLFYVFAGYGSIDYVHSHVDIFNFSSNKWADRFNMPKDMGHSHLGVATDGRYIYAVSGQYGPQCRRPTSRVFVLDSETKKWKSLPPLPAPRYAPATQLWRGRLHVMGGSKENRHTPGVDHWSLAVKDGQALEKQWRTETPIPRGGPHRACIAANDRLYIIGGQEGDFMAKPGSPIFKCSRRHERFATALLLVYYK